MTTIDLSQYGGEDRVISSLEMAEEIRARRKPTVKFFSKIPALDRLLDGFEPGELVAISGPTKHGKSLLAQTLTVNFLEQQVFTLWFTFELPPKQFLERFGDRTPLLYLPRIHRQANLKWLLDRIRESAAKYHTQAVVIDHLHYVFDIGRSKNPSIDIGTTIRTLKSLAVEMELVIFVLCHTVKAKADGGDVGYEGIRDSSFVGQESDVVLVVQRRPEKGE
ncbi:MAG TPA: DnaB-like helicase C-terminal domain-containing protein, partial [Syntrophales bacterium]|nr:DnaB-like helicase C-terminal domain-containing protein [Syntrophales bacterium]